MLAAGAVLALLGVLFALGALFRLAVKFLDPLCLDVVLEEEDRGLHRPQRRGGEGEDVRHTLCTLYLHCQRERRVSTVDDDGEKERTDVLKLHMGRASLG